MVVTVADAYNATGGAWQAGPGRIYDRLAADLVRRCPGGVTGRTVLDLGAGTGAATRAALAAGATAVVASDLATGMLAFDAGARPPAVVGDAVALPFAEGAFGAVVAAFSLNHLTDPAAGLRQAARVLAAGGGLAASAYAEDDTHPVKGAVEAACAASGWVSPPWIDHVRSAAIPKLATVERAQAAAAAAGLTGATATHDRVPFAELTAAQLVRWRLGMAQVAPFVATLDAPAIEALTADAVERLGPVPPPLVRSVITLTWRKP